ncbi:hypothetical protein EGW08_010636 [Elysia chlorotica]|uniref:Sodium/nucleoside cotransporter n=1 Tax=Elysia chlorotica TaxID=188477 RepID=A0A433TJ79_ELYCH|nr:hypothetical protein EGW08_010636 [Elysia chlorotica]
MSESHSPNQVKEKPITESTVELEANPSSLLEQSGIASIDSAQPPTPSPGRSSITAKPVTQQNHRKSGSRTSARRSALDTEDLPPPPPPPPELEHQHHQRQEPVVSVPFQGKSPAISTGAMSGGKQGASPLDNDNDSTVAVDIKGPMKRASGNGEVPIEMNQLSDPTVVEIIQSNPNGKHNSIIEPNDKTKDAFDETKDESGSFIDKEDKSGEEDEMSDFDELDLDDRDNMENAWKEAGIFSRAVLLCQNFVYKVLDLLKRLTSGYLWTLVFLIGYIVYFVFAMVHKFGDEGSYRLLICTALGVWIVVWPYIKSFIKVSAKKIYGSDELSVNHVTLLRKTRTVIRWLLYFVVTAFMVYVLVDEGRKNLRNLQALPGIFAFLLIALIFSTRPSKIAWHTIFWSVALQFICAMFVLKFKYGKDTIVWMQDRFTEFFENTYEGGMVIFGPTWKDHMFIFGALPLIWFTNGVFTMLYNLGAMQYIIDVIGKVLQFITGVSTLEAMSISAGIFMEGFTNLVVMRPFLNQLTKSQLFAVLTGCLSSLGGSYLALLSTLGVSLEYVIPAMVVSAPATFAICKLMVPEARDDAPTLKGDANKLCSDEKGKYSNLLEAFQTGGVSVLAATGNVCVLGYIFLSMVSFINHTFEWFGDRVGVDNFSIELISSYALYPVALAMGVAPEDCRRVAMLLGYRIGIFNVVAFLKLTGLKVNRLVYLQYMEATGYNGTITHHYNNDITLDLWNQRLESGYLSERSEAIATYCLCGFSSAMSAVLTVGVIYVFAPKRKKWVSGKIIAAIVAGNLANCMTGCFASLFF